MLLLVSLTLIFAFGSLVRCEGTFLSVLDNLLFLEVCQLLSLFLLMILDSLIKLLNIELSILMLLLLVIEWVGHWRPVEGSRSKSILGFLSSWQEDRARPVLVLQLIGKPLISLLEVLFTLDIYIVFRIVLLEWTLLALVPAYLSCNSISVWTNNLLRAIGLHNLLFIVCSVYPLLLLLLIANWMLDILITFVAYWVSWWNLRRFNVLGLLLRWRSLVVIVYGHHVWGSSKGLLIMKVLIRCEHMRVFLW